MSYFIEVPEVGFYYDSYSIDDNTERVLLNGWYTICRYRNPHPELTDIVENFYSGVHSPFIDKQIYVEGNILYCPHLPNIQDLVDQIIRSTYEPEIPMHVNTAVTELNQKIYGVPFPYKEVIYRFQGYVFTLYDRYVFGHEKTYVHFKNDNPYTWLRCGQSSYNYLGLQNFGEESTQDAGLTDKPDPIVQEEDYLKTLRAPKVCRREIILPSIPLTDDLENPLLYRDNFAFSITHEESGVLAAFGIYR